MKETLINQVKKPIANGVIIKFLYLRLTLNNFVFNGINYFQKKGCAMGTIWAPAYANIFMGKFDRLHIYHYLRNFSTFYCRFIDDIFFLWNGTESELIKFIDIINQNYPTIKFEFIYSRNSITFLDTKVYKNKNGTLCTNIYRKQSDRHNFLHYKSAHPKALKVNMPFSQALLVKRICSETSEVIKHLKDLKDAFIKRDYQSKILDHHFERAMSVRRIILLENKEKPSTQGNLPLVLTFNKTLPNIKNVIDKHWQYFIYQ